ncbi:MAG: hypothetical protein KKH92_07335 [Firmicutes bacterium]|nr:hypothetical protein [Bacillota bacterium]
MSDLYKMIEGVFPNTEILLIYYGGSIAYGLDSELSDIDITVVLEGFRGNLHLTLGEYDLFVFAKDRFIQRQTFDESIIAYHRAAADNVMSIDRTLIYINPSFQETLDQLLIYDDKEFMINHIAAELEYGRMRFEVNTNFKSHYHVFRIRGMVDHYEKTGRYELVVEEPWFTKMMDFKNNWDNEIAQNYVEEIKSQLDYLENYRNEMIQSGLG